MTQEDKQLLLRDLCARLPYGVYVDIYSWQKDSPRLLVECVPEYIGEEVVLKNLAGRHSIKEVKPYLRPMSSMTEEEQRELHGRYNVFSDTILNTLTLREHSEGYWDEDTECSFVDYLWFIDWLNSHHFDYRGLIPMGLALEAPEGMYDE